MKPLTANELRRRYIDFFVKRYEHKEIASSSVIPDNDPTVLFTTAGMHPLVPYLMGESHPSGKRLVDAQKCIRTDDIDEVGDSSHCTFFEMMGNWSLGDYFKKEAIQMSFEFLTGTTENFGIGLDPKRLYVTVFAGDSDAPKDLESIGYWKEQFAKIGIEASEGVAGKDEPAGLGGENEFGGGNGSENLSGVMAGPRKGTQARALCAGPRIFAYEKKKNWWGPAGQTGPCGPDTEMFYLVRPELAHDSKFGAKCHPNCDCGRYVEIWNDVFMQYNKTSDGKYEPLAQQNVDTGLGLERVTAILQGKKSHYETELFAPVINKIRELSRVGSDSRSHASSRVSSDFPEAKRVRLERIIADHLRSAVFILGDPNGVCPSNTDQGYILRRLIRRAIRSARQLGFFDENSENFTAAFGETFVEIYGGAYPELTARREHIVKELDREETRFRETILKGEKEFEKQMAPFSGAGSGSGGANGGGFSGGSNNSAGVDPFAGEDGAVSLVMWMNVLKQAFESDARFSEVAKTLGARMKDVQGVLRDQAMDVFEKAAALRIIVDDATWKMLVAISGDIAARRIAFSGKRAFYFYETYGFPKELIVEMLSEYGLQLEEVSFDVAFKAHQDLSRAGAEQKFSGGLADHSWECTLLHTATHLVHQALRDVLGNHVLQRGSNITRDRLRFDFSHTEKMTPEQISRVEEIVNTQIQRNLSVHFEILDTAEAKARGAIGVFDDKYASLGNKIKVYFMGDYSKEVCGGPHVAHTVVLKSLKITKEEAVSDGVRRIKAIVGGLGDGMVPESERIVAKEE